METHVAQLRRFNRTVTRKIGVLNEHFPGRNRSLGESRLLFEIGAGGADLKALRARLGLDSGYLSRLVRALERQGLVETTVSARDARVRRARLTRAGRAELDALDRLSDAAADSLLSALAGKQRERLVAAMAEVERLLGASDVTIGAEPPGGEDAQWCLAQYFALLNARFEGGYDPASAKPADTQDFTPPKGVFLVARALAQPIGCAGLRAAGPGIGELKRLWVAEDARGLGIGQRLLDVLEAQARTLGFDVLRLDTNRSLTEAQALYRKNGYRAVPPFNDDPYPDFWFEKRLN